jgi:hypothetical protein
LHTDEDIYLYGGYYVSCEIFLISILLDVFLYCVRKISKIIDEKIYLRQDKTGYKFCSGPRFVKRRNVISIMCHISLT